MMPYVPDDELLASVIAAQSPNHALQVLLDRGAVASAKFADALRDRALRCETEGQLVEALHARELADVLQAFRRSAEEAAAVTSLETLVEWLIRSWPAAWFPSSRRMFEAIAARARAEGDLPLAESVARCLGLWRELAALLEQLSEALRDPAELSAAIERSPLLLSDEFLRYLRHRAEIEATSGGDPMPWRAAAQGLTDFSRLVKAREEKRAMTPMTDVEATHWYLRVPPHLRPKITAAAQQVADGSKTIPEAIEELAQDPAVTDAGTRVQLTSLFLENAARTCPPQMLPCYTWATRLLVDVPVPEAHPHFKATMALHHAMGLQQRWRGLPNPVPVLRNAAELLRSSLDELQPGKGPRLRRDLHLYRARVLELLAERDAHLLDEAIAEYRAALAVDEVAHEHLSRGSILGDLANALGLRLRTLGGGDEDEIDRIYRRALTHLDGSTEPAVRASVLANWAMVLNDRESGDVGRQQELALKLIQEGLDLLDSVGETGLADPSRIRFLRASLERTRGNVMQARAYGDPLEMNRAALDAYDCALHAVGRGDAAALWLRGTIQLNRGHVLLNLTELVTEPALHLGDAADAFEEAAVLLEDDLGAHASALAGRAAASFSEPTEQTVEDLRQAIREFEGISAPAAAAHARYNLGQLLDHTGDRAAASGEFVAAGAAFEASGDLGGAASAILRAARAAWLGEDGASAVRLYGDAARLADEFWHRRTATEGRLEASELVARAYAGLLWARAHGELEPDAAWALAAKAKHPHLSVRIHELASADHEPASFRGHEQLRLKRRRLDVARWRIQGDEVRAHESLADAIEAVERQADELDLVLAPAPAPAPDVPQIVSKLLRELPRAAILDITVSELGTILIWARGAECRIHRAPLMSAQLRVELAHWRAAYAARLEEPACWIAAAEHFLAFLGEFLLAEVATGELAGVDLFVVPGETFGLPLHAAPIDVEGRRIPLLELLGSCTYIPTAAAATRRITVPQSALCVLADTAADPDKQLQAAPDELGLVCDLLCRAGVEVSVLVGRGADRGLAVLADAEVYLHPKAILIPSRPTPALTIELLAAHQHLFFTGHGGAEGLASLQMFDDHGAARDLTALDLFEAGIASGRQFVLSACETATQPVPDLHEPVSLVAFLLRLGAEWVVSTAWIVKEDVAAAFSQSFYAELVKHGWDPALAFREAVVEIRRAHPRSSDWAPFMLFRGPTAPTPTR